MSLGELAARTEYRVYYRLEDLTDFSGNGRTLTNNNTVLFSPAKFANGADFGSSGTNKALSFGTNPMSALTYANATFSFWVKFNSTSNPTSGSGYFFTLATRVTSGSGAARCFSNYTVSGGNFNINFTIKLATGDATSSFTIPVNTTNWYNFIYVKTGTTTGIAYLDGIEVATATGSGADTVNVNSLCTLSIGNIGHTAFANQGWHIMDEFIIEQRVWTPAQIKKYYSQGRGFLAAA